MKKNLFKLFLLISLPIYLYGFFNLDLDFSGLGKLGAISKDLSDLSESVSELDSLDSNLSRSVDGVNDINFSALDNIKKIGTDLEGISDLNKDLNSTLSSIDNLFESKSSNSTKVPSDANLSQNKKIPTDQCKCILFEENNLIINLTNFNRRESFVVSATLASDQNYSQSYFCMTNLRVDRKDFWCIDDYDSWNLWFRVNDKEDFKVKFGDTIRLDGEYDQTVGGTVSKDIVIKDTTNYIQGKCVPCL